ncbi:hypothetical protein MFIFM68171_08056 [Madurella fahalii]|uniref:Uncharacterized protein n=1 Tax=Madurella fahalii TaxID=1157608 RepID=A0ABQ0GJC9_9PEZI
MSELNDNTAVFCVAEIPQDVLNDFFSTAYSAPEFANEGVDDVGVLINTTDLSTITGPTKPPVPAQTLFPFLNKTPEEIWDFAQRNVRAPIFNRALAILDDRTREDRATCLLVTQWENPPPGREGRLLKVRADFRSALVILNVKNLGIGGDEHFRAGAEGVIPLSE